MKKENPDTINGLMVQLTPTHYIVAVEAELKAGSYFYYTGLTFQGTVCDKFPAGIYMALDNNKEGMLITDGGLGFKAPGNYYVIIGYNVPEKECKLITHSTKPIELKRTITIDKLVFYKIKSLSLSEVEELIYGYSTYELFKKVDGTCEKGEYEHWLFEQGINIHKELVKNTVEKAIQILEEENYGQGSINRDEYKARVISKFQTLLPKTEWNVEFKNGKLKLI